jgi:hypothetical protein
MDEWVWSIGGMVLTGETEALEKKTYSSDILSTRNLALKCLWSNPGLRGGRPETDRLNHDMAID